MRIAEGTTIKTPGRLLVLGCLLLFLSLSIVACGQRGPLYLPEENVQTNDQAQATMEEENTAENKHKDENGTANEETP